MSILLADLLIDWLSKNEAPPERLIRDKLTFTNSRFILNESFRPVTEVGSSSTFPKKKTKIRKISTSMHMQRDVCICRQVVNENYPVYCNMSPIKCS